MFFSAFYFYLNSTISVPWNFTFSLARVTSHEPIFNNLGFWIGLKIHWIGRVRVVKLCYINLLRGEISDCLPWKLAFKILAFYLGLNTNYTCQFEYTTIWSTKYDHSKAGIGNPRPPNHIRLAKDFSPAHQLNIWTLII